MKEFKKSDLTETMVCMAKKGSAYSLKDINETNYYWNDDLTTKYDVDDEIVAIYDLKDLQPIWQREEPIVLNKKEKAVLVLYDEYKWIGRDTDNELIVYIAKPEKLTSYWVKTDDEAEYFIPKNLFQFVKWEDEEPTSLDELRKGL